VFLQSLVQNNSICATSSVYIVILKARLLCNRLVKEEHSYLGDKSSELPLLEQ
jgi:hypothetical protein